MYAKKQKISKGLWCALPLLHIESGGLLIHSSEVGIKYLIVSLLKEDPLRRTHLLVLAQ